jgi:hypothetical protein
MYEYENESWTLSQRDEQKLRTFQGKVLKKIYESTGEKEG